MLLANTPAQAESFLHCLEQVTGVFSFHVNANKTEYMCFNYEGAVFNLNSGSLKLVNKITYLGSSVSSTENDINMHLAAWSAINRLSIMCKKWLIWCKRKGFSKQWLCQYCTNAPHEPWKNVQWERLTVNSQEYYMLYWKNPGISTPRNNSCTATYLLSPKQSK